MSATTEKALEAVDPAEVPSLRLPGGGKIPGIGLGTFGSDRFNGEQVSQAVLGAIRAGYRFIDCASVYGNEHVIGGALQAAVAEGCRREDLWITSKVWNDMHGDGDVLLSCAKTLKDLRLDYLDLFLVHWPFPNYHEPGCSGDSRSSNAKPYIHESFMRTWRQMERLVRAGLVRHIGTSNMTIPKLKLVLRDAEIKPVANEMEIHPHFQQPELFDFVTGQGLVPIGFSPIGSPMRPERDKTSSDSVDIEDPVIVAAAQKRGVHPAVICVKWAAQRGQIPIPFSTRPAGYISNLRAVTEDPLSAEEMKAIAGIDKKCRLIKGQVFLWKEGQSWEDLWDENGKITPP